MCLCLCHFLGTVSGSQISSSNTNSDSNRNSNCWVAPPSPGLWPSLSGFQQSSTKEAGARTTGTGGGGGGTSGTPDSSMPREADSCGQDVSLPLIPMALHCSSDRGAGAAGSLLNMTIAGRTSSCSHSGNFIWTTVVQTVLKITSSVSQLVTDIII